MVMNFYLTAESLAKSGNQLDRLYACLAQLLADIGCSKPYKDENIFYITNKALEYPIKGIPFVQLLYKSDYDGEQKAILNTLFSLYVKGDLLKGTSKNIEEIKHEIKNNNEDISTGIISLEAIEGIAESNQIVYDQKTWIDFRREHICTYIQNSDHYLLQCQKYYDRLFFHEHNYCSIKPIFSDYKISITNALNQLNDVFYPLHIENKGMERVALLKMFNANTHLETVVQGKKKKKLDAEFDFIDANGNRVPLFCELHIKLTQSDKKGDDKYEYNRIYFHEPHSSISEGEKILIAHIGKHLHVKGQ